MAKVRTRFDKGIILEQENIQGVGGENLSIEGELAVDSSDSKLKSFLDGQTRSVVTEDQAQDLSNKDIDADVNTISNLEVDNLKSGVLNTDLSAGAATDTEIPSALAVQEYVGDVQAIVDDLVTLTGVPANSEDLGTFSGTIISDNATIKEALQEVELFDIDSRQLIDDLVTLSGVAANATDLGTFTGNIIPDGSDNKEALQALETAIDSAVAGGVVGPASATDNALVRFDGTTGKLVENSVGILTDAGALSGLTNLTVDNLNLDGNTITGGTSSVAIGTNIVSTTATEIHNGAVVHSPLSDTTTTGANATVIAGNNKIVILSNASLTSIDMIVSNLSGQEITLINRTGNTININNDTGATAVYRIKTGTGAAVPFPTDTAFNFVFDTLGNRWAVSGGTGSSGAAGNTLNLFNDPSFESGTTTDFTVSAGSGVLSINTTETLDTPENTNCLSAAMGASSTVSSTFALNSKYDGVSGVLSGWIKTPQIVTIRVNVDSNQVASATIPASNVWTPFKLDFDLGATNVQVFFDNTTAATYFLDEMFVGAKDYPTELAGLVEQGDSMIRLQGFSANGSTATKIPRFTSLVQSIGSDIVYQDSATAGASFTVQTSGIYTINFSMNSAVNTNGISGISKNSTQLTTNIDSITSTDRLAISYAPPVAAQTAQPQVSWTGYLVEGDVIRPHTQGANGTALADFTISKQGSLKQVTVNTNQKATIPTSELKFEGAAALGATNTAIVKFDTIAKLRGDAFSVVSTTAAGTEITVLKSGKLSVTASLNMLNPTSFIVTKNQAVLTAASPSASERLATASLTANLNITVSHTGDVTAGDVIRVTAGTAPTANTGNALTLSFQEQSLQVSVSNTLPQFSESDTSLRLSGANGFGSTATTTRRFASVVQNIGTDVQYTDSATLGGQFQVLSSGIYNLSFTESSTANSTSSAVIILLNGTNLAYDQQQYNTANTNPKFCSASWQGYLTQGDVITCAVSVAANNNGTDSLFTISKVGKPNVTGVDVTPFVEIPQPEMQSSTLSSVATFNNAQVTGALTTSVNSGIYSYDSTTGLYTVLKKTKIDLNFSAQSSAAAVITTGIRINGTTFNIASSDAAAVSFANSSYSGTLNIGETFAFFVGSNASNIQRISVSAIALSDQILTPPETFSTDTASLVYAGSATYTLATLANAPVGTFITFTYAANTNTRTQTTTAPTQTTSDMNANGIQIFTRTYNATSTAAQPAAIAVQIGKGLKGFNLGLYKNTGKSGEGTLDEVQYSSTIRYGCAIKNYNETTGILVIDAGINFLTTTTSSSFGFSDVTAQGNGYLVINASKNPALTGLGFNTVAAKVHNTSGQSIPNTNALTIITFDSAKIFDTHNAFNTASGTFTAPESGYYQISWSVYTNNLAWAVGNSAQSVVFKNGSQSLFGNSPYVEAASTQPLNTVGSGLLYLLKNDTVDLRFSNNRTAGATALNSTALANTISIVKVSL